MDQSSTRQDEEQKPVFRPSRSALQEDALQGRAPLEEAGKIQAETCERLVARVRDMLSAGRGCLACTAWNTVCKWEGTGSDDPASYHPSVLLAFIADVNNAQLAMQEEMKKDRLVEEVESLCQQSTNAKQAWDQHCAKRGSSRYPREHELLFLSEFLNSYAAKQKSDHLQFAWDWIPLKRNFEGAEDTHTSGSVSKKLRTASVFQKEELCKKWNDQRGCLGEKVCGKAHRCDVLKADGNACGSTTHNRKACQYKCIEDAEGTHTFGSLSKKRTTASVFQNEKLCKAWNDQRGCPGENVCGKAHRCDVLKADGNVCGSTNHNRKACQYKRIEDAEETLTPGSVSQMPRTASVFQNEELCKKWNDQRGCPGEKDCGKTHRCDMLKADGKVCGSTTHNRRACQYKRIKDAEGTHTFGSVSKKLRTAGVFQNEDLCKKWNDQRGCPGEKVCGKTHRCDMLKADGNACGSTTHNRKACQYKGIEDAEDTHTFGNFSKKLTTDGLVQNEELCKKWNDERDFFGEKDSGKDPRCDVLKADGKVCDSTTHNREACQYKHVEDAEDTYTPGSVSKKLRTASVFQNEKLCKAWNDQRGCPGEKVCGKAHRCDVLKADGNACGSTTHNRKACQYKPIEGAEDTYTFSSLSKKRTADVFQNEDLCKKWNDQRGCPGENVCGKAHRCDMFKADGNVCGSTNHNRKACKYKRKKA